MDIPPEFAPLDAPNFNPGELSQDLQLTAQTVGSHLKALSRHCRRAATSIALFEFAMRKAGEGRIFTDWARTGGRDAVMAVRDYGESLRLVGSLAGQCTKNIDFASLKTAKKQFKAAFPFAEIGRHAVAHPEFYSDATRTMAATDPTNLVGFDVQGGSKVLMHETIMFDTFISTFEGEVSQLKMTPETALKLVEITKLVFGAMPRA